MHVSSWISGSGGRNKPVRGYVSIVRLLPPHVPIMKWIIMKLTNICWNETASQIKLVFILSDVNECADATHECSENAVCINTFGSYVCRCKDGYRGNGRTCYGKT